MTASAPIAPPEPDLTPEEMIRRAPALRPVLRERQAECEALGRLPQSTNAAFVEAGFYRLRQPRCVQPKRKQLYRMASQRPDPLW
jgi:3-hydroxy-9,10-secoandrosta-1,3,5(10)-triene-9,17-dione monooxygenase